MTGRVVFVSESLSNWGAEASLRLLAQAAPFGHDNLTLIVSDLSPLLTDDAFNHFERRGYRFAAHPALGNGSFRSASLKEKLREIPTIIQSAARLRHLFKKGDVVVAFSYWQIPETVLAAKLARVPVVIDLHETFANGAATRLTRLLSRVVDGVISPSHSLLVRNKMENQRRVHVVPRPVGFPKSDTDRDNPTTYNVGIVGQVAEHKQVHRFVDAADRLQSDKVRFTIVGGEQNIARRSEYENTLRSRVEQSLANVNIVDRTADVRSVYKHLDVLVNISEHEAFGRTVVEALRCCVLPVVLVDTGPAEIVEDTGVGVVLRDVEGLGTFLTMLDMGKYDDQFRHRNMWPEKTNSYESSSVAVQYFSTLARLATRAKRWSRYRHRGAQ